jgi:7,8-dihydropterin-6-yl-methyl-4-(beta-D-ribofuranosyl)aminobenzene 5'-phosphate synthase
MININDIKITIVCENSVADVGFMGEWGLSMLVDLNGLRILFDTGGGLSLVHNARQFRLDLSTVDRVVLSHGHKDHTGGLVPALSEIRAGRPGQDTEILAHPGTLDLKYYQAAPDKAPFYAGVPFALEQVRSLGGRLSLSRAPVWLNGDVVTSGEIDMVTGYESVEPGCLLKTEGGFVKDPLDDEVALYVRTTQGLLVVLGCAHRGLINAIYHGQNVTGMQRVYMAIGGTHLAHAPQEQVAATMAALRELRIEWLGASHCTGMATGCRLAAEMPGIFFHGNAGSVVTFADDRMELKAF